jgi:hypothetical protein
MAKKPDGIVIVAIAIMTVTIILSAISSWFGFIRMQVLTEGCRTLDYFMCGWYTYLAESPIAYLGLVVGTWLIAGLLYIRGYRKTK